MSHRIKIVTEQAIELGEVNNTDSNIKLLGTKALGLKNQFIQSAIDEKQLNTDVSLLSTYFSPDDEFMYSVEVASNSTSRITFVEIGIGYLTKDSLSLVRSNPLYSRNVNGSITPIVNGPTEFIEFQDDFHLIVKNYYPNNLAELFVQDHSVLASRDTEYFPVPVHIPTDSVLGRRSDQICPISFDSLREDTISTIQSYTKQLILKSSQINVRKLKTKQIVLEPHDKPDEKAGTLYYSKDNDNLMFFDGNQWRKIILE